MFAFGTQRRLKDGRSCRRLGAKRTLTDVAISVTNDPKRQRASCIFGSAQVDHVGDVAVRHMDPPQVRPFRVRLDGGEQAAGRKAQFVVYPFQIQLAAVGVWHRRSSP
jgi:hypothetical protein